MNTPAIATTSLTKTYGSRTVVDSLDLLVPEGCVYGFLGPNGAGKSTTMKMLLSFVEPTSGTVEVFGEPMRRSSRRRLLGGIGSLIESPPGYLHLTGAENMQIVRRMQHLPADQVEWAVQAVRLQDQMGKTVRQYSLGMKQCLGIAMALARRPRLLILDEPTNGLDPAGIEEIRELLQHLAHQGVTVMISSHLLSEIDRMATMLGIVSDGRLVFQGTRDLLVEQSAPDVLVRTTDPERAARTLASHGAQRTGEHEVLLPSHTDQHTAAAVHRLVSVGIGVHEVHPRSQSLEDVFSSLTVGGAL